MNLKQLEKANKTALRNTKRFRRKATLDLHNLMNERFHRYRNAFPFYGAVEVRNSGCFPFLMYSNQDDVVAQTYFWYGNNSYERASMSEWINRSKQSSCIYDVGAYTGLYALSANAANPDACVSAFEASRRTYSRLLINKQLNSIGSKLKLVNMALSNEEAELRFLQYRGEQVLGAGASFIDKEIKVFDSSEKVSAITLDSHVESCGDHLDLIKIDVEESEALVLNGMSGVLDRDGPDVIVEVTLTTVKEVVPLLKKHGYRFYLLSDLKMESVRLQDPIEYLQEYALAEAKERFPCNLLAEKR